MTGVDLAKAIHAMRPQIPILMMSGYVPEAFHSSFPQLGDFSILLKPFSIESLKNMVMKRLSSAIQPVSSS
jgi:DNA-binding NtrC family response regulator